MRKNVWKDIKVGEMLTAVIAGIVVTLFGALLPVIGPFIGSKINQIGASFLNTPMPVWWVFICFFVMSMVLFRPGAKIKILWWRWENPLPRIFFNSSNATSSWFASFGHFEWDGKIKKLVGIRGVGKLVFEDKIMMITRENKEGKFEIILRHYTYGETISEYISSDIGGRNPRRISIEFKCRSLSGKHKIIVILRPKDAWNWISSDAFPIDRDEWQSMRTELTAEPTDEFVIEFQTYSFKPNSRFQIKDLVVKEV